MEAKEATTRQNNKLLHLCHFLRPLFDCPAFCDPANPPTVDYNRGEVLCAGFSIWEEENSFTKISYYNQATPGVLPYISTDIAGLSSSFYCTFASCSAFLEQNKDSLACLPTSTL